MAALRLGVVSQWFDPEPGSAAVIGALCRALADHGHEVHVLTGLPNYPTGKVYPGYRVRPYQYEQMADVHVHRVPVWPSHDRSGARRALTYLSFAVAASTQLKLLRSMDACLVVASPATVALPAMLAHRFFGRPYALQIQDLWPDTVVESGFVRPGRTLKLISRILGAFCNASYRRAAAITVTSPGMADILRGRGVPEQKLSFIPNWVDETAFRPVPRNDVRNGLTAMYAGSLGDLQGLETVIEAARLLSDLPDFRLVLVGSGVAESKLHAAAAGLSNVVFLGQQPLDRMASLLAGSDVQIIALRDLPLFRTTLPSKLQAIMAAGRPIAGCVAGDAADLIEQSGAGLVARPGDAAEFAAVLRRMHSFGVDKREAMGRAGREYYLNHLSAKAGVTALANLVRAISGGHYDR